MYRIYIPGMDIDLQNEDADFLIEFIKAIKNDEFLLQALEWVDKDVDFPQISPYSPNFWEKIRD